MAAARGRRVRDDQAALEAEGEAALEVGQQDAAHAEKEVSHETPVCVACLKPLTDEERMYFDYRCTECEGKWFERIQAWRRGKPDPELDREYGGEYGG